MVAQVVLQVYFTCPITTICKKVNNVEWTKNGLLRKEPSTTTRMECFPTVQSVIYTSPVLYLQGATPFGMSIKRIGPELLWRRVQVMNTLLYPATKSIIRHTASVSATNFGFVAFNMQCQKWPSFWLINVLVIELYQRKRLWGPLIIRPMDTACAASAHLFTVTSVHVTPCNGENEKRRKERKKKKDDEGNGMKKR